ncbi:DeoR family transcriptional regulator [Pseudoroseomonas cervicalis]|uniref:Transcriptional regulator, DeoR family n=1 Tax=Pseudoroseomonas cervicalis ATCC 49957 TaxID=525371 RepID=D5RJW6_9PROT|nr:DeoR/GlpR family DNA-binding transcription regulator [Pseudoroseomonas cervicalis]EFH12405.1 transcriptional regulator, DeoR family [Pseudoroseomonas cervicalis ATCC 49957]
MIPAERQNLIVARLSGRGVLSIAELTELLGVSHMTVRRDIQQLEREGRVMSVAGGISLPERISFEPSHSAKAAMAHAEKVAIGRLALEVAPPAPGAVVYLDAGTTTLELARHLAARDDIAVVTNDFVIAALLTRESRCRLYHTGGQVERENESCVGDPAAEAIRRFNFDIAFISTSSFGLRGVSTPSENKVAVKRAIAQSASRSLLVTDSSKYGRIGTFNAVPLEALSAIVTDSGLPEDVRLAIRQRGVALHIATAEPALAQGETAA